MSAKNGKAILKTGEKTVDKAGEKSAEREGSSLVEQIKAARRVSVPLVAITTPDPAATMTTVGAAVNDGKAGRVPQLVWDILEGLRARNEAGKTVRAALISGEFDPTIANPAAMLRLLQDTPKETAIFMHLAHRWFADPQVIQGMMNLRDLFKQDHRTLILLTAGGMDINLPAELAGDVVVFDEPLPGRNQLSAIVREQHETADLKLDDKTTELAVEAVQGLPAFQAEQVTALCLRKSGLDLEQLWERKRRQIENTPGLKVHREKVSFSDIGGVELIKQFLTRVLHGQARPNAVVFVDEIEKGLAGAGSGGGGGDTSGVAQDQLGALLSYMQDQGAAGMIFVGPPGCLSGDTEFLYRRGKRNSGRRITLQRLFEKFNGLPCQGGRGEVTPWHKPCDTFLHSYDHESGKVFYNRIINVRDSGEKPCIILILTSGERLRLTSDHPVLTPDGFVQAGELRTSDEVICRGDMLPHQIPQRAPRKERVIVRGLKHYSSGANADVTDPTSGITYHYKRQYRARLVVEAGLNSMGYERYVDLLRTDPSAIHLKTLPDDDDVHHKNEDAMDDRPENLQVLPHSDHPLEHEPLDRFGVEYTRVERVAFVGQAGSMRTFDIQMQSPANNFATADGLFVHNSAKSMCAKAAGNAAGIPTIQLDLGAMKGSLVGQSEQNLRAALKVITSVSNRRSLWIATCNSIGELPPELRRRFTLGTFFFDLPDATERKEIWKLYQKQYDFIDAEIKHVNDEGWTGAEIKQCCDIAYRLGCPLKEAQQFVVPVSRSAAEQLDRLRKAADGRFLSASKPGVYSRQTEMPRHGAKRSMSLSETE